MGSSTTSKVRCPKCGSDDCNYTVESLGELVAATLRRHTTFCNQCTYVKVSLVVNAREICVETRLPGQEDTDLEYHYPGKDKF